MLASGSRNIAGVGRRASSVLLNKNRDWVVLVLDSVKELRRAYREAGLDDMKQCDLDLRSLLSDEECSRALDQQLRNRGWRPRSLDDQTLVAREVELCEKFGYTRREVMQYVRQARTAVARGKPHLEIENTEQLVEHLKLLCDQTTHELSRDWSLWSRRRNVHRIRSRAEERLFGIGALVADAARRTNFDLSYVLAAVSLHQGDA